MARTTDLALEALRRIRRKSGVLSPGETRALDQDLARIESALCAPHRDDDPYAMAQGTPADLGNDLAGGSAPAPRRDGPAAAAPPPPPPSSPPSSGQIGERAATALEAVDFPGFVAALVNGTFKAIVDSTAEQVRQYADLVSSLSKSVDDFSRDNVTPNQARDWMVARHPADLAVALPAAGAAGTPRLVPRAGRAGESPAWLGEYGLGGQELTEELTEGPLVERGRNGLGEERLQTLATMVLLGINRVVVSEGDLRAKMQFHAVGRDLVNAESSGGQIVQQTVAARTVGQPNAAMMISTLKANVQAEASIRADLMGEVRIAFRSETFPLERFADTQAIQLLNRHAKWKGEGAAAPAPAPAAQAPAAAAPAPAPAPAPEANE